MFRFAPTCGCLFGVVTAQEKVALLKLVLKAYASTAGAHRPPLPLLLVPEVLACLCTDGRKEAVLRCAALEMLIGLSPLGGVLDTVAVVDVKRATEPLRDDDDPFVQNKARELLALL